MPTSAAGRFLTRRLFAERGYAGTTMAQLAAEAGVAMQTIYTRVGSKPAVVEALVDAIDEEARVPALAKRTGETTSATEVLALVVRLTRQPQEPPPGCSWAGSEARALYASGFSLAPEPLNCGASCSSRLLNSLQFSGGSQRLLSPYGAQRSHSLAGRPAGSERSWDGHGTEWCPSAEP